MSWYEPEEKSDPAEILEEAAKLIESGRWTQKEDELDGSYCALGAIAVCTKGAVVGAPSNYLCHVVVTKVMEYLESIGFKNGVVSWNDCPSRTKEEVANALREAANRCRTRSKKVVEDK